jgi:hypothetical protein
LDTEDGIGVQLTPAVGLACDWKEFVGEIAKSATELVLKGPIDATVGGVGAFSRLILSIRVEPDPAYRVWSLALLSFAWALDEVKISVLFERATVSKALKAAIRSVKSQAEKNGIFIPERYLRRPLSLPMYKRLKDVFLNELPGGRSESASQDLSFKIDSAYVRATFEVWTKRPDYYEPIVAAVSAPSAATAELSLSWDAYRAQLVHEFEVKPVFGQEERGVSIAQLYVPLRGFWPKAEYADAGTYYDPTDRSIQANIAMIDDALAEWLSSDSAEDWIRLIGGGPGSGKSTTLKALARRAADLTQWRPLLIPLQRIQVERDLKEAINAFFTEQTDGAFTLPPLGRESVEDGAPLLLIFDGLDEIAAPSEAAKDVIGTFANKLSNLHSSLQGSGSRKVKVVVSGRMPAFQVARRYLCPPHDGSIEVYGFLPSRLADFELEYEYEDEEDTEEETSLWSIDQRSIWWSQYARAVGENISVPPAFRSARLKDLTHEPLLCYLLTLAGYATEHWELAAENRNRIYGALIESVYERGWGDGARKRLGPGRNLKRGDFNKLMETIALAAWLGGDSRVASETGFEEAVEITEAQDAWQEFSKDNGSDVTNLAMNFYLRSSEKSQRGFEFTHKSFGEYLAARAILNVADDVAAEGRRKIDHVMRDWFTATSGGAVTSEMLQFMRDEVRLRLSSSKSARVHDRVRKVKGVFQSIVKYVSTDGFPIDSSGRTWRSLETAQANAECAAWVIVNCCALAFSSIEETEDAKVNIAWNSKDELSSILARAAVVGSVLPRCMSQIQAKGQTLRGFEIQSADFSGANLQGIVVLFVTVHDSSFSRANLKDARFYLCNIMDTSFLGAELENVIFHMTALSSCNMADVAANKVIFSSSSGMFSSPSVIEMLGAKAKIMTPSTDILISDVQGYLSRRLDSLGKLETEVRGDLVNEVSAEV